MAAIMGVEPQRVEPLCCEVGRAGATARVVSRANFNAPGQIVIAGARARPSRASSRARRRGEGQGIPLKVSAPFHCALMAPAASRR